MSRRNLLVVIFLVMLAVAGFFTWRFNNQTSFPKLAALPNESLPFDIPDGFTMEIYAKDLANPRVLAFDPKGRMIVSETSAGRVTLVKPRSILLEGLDNPHGLAFYESYLYVATTREVVRYPYDAETATVDIDNKKNIASLPEGGRHLTRTIGFGKDFRDEPLIVGQKESRFVSPTKLYISIGSSCDACLENTWKHAAILESDPEGTYTAEVAGGLRNSVFFTFHPATGELWATEMGRDGLGDDLPPDEVNIIKPNAKYGWPYCYGNRVQDTTFTEQTDRSDLPMDCSKTEPPVIEIPAHSAPLGIAFLSPAELLVAYHGSWNRSEPTGYKIVRFDEQRQPHDFITGWLADKNTIFGRPADLKFDDQANLFISDDAAGIIYRVTPPAL